jgi:hypothetical protein
MDMRAVNKKTVGISYSLPRIDDTLSRLHGMTGVTTLDLTGAFHLLPIQKETDRRKTAFATPSGLFQWKVLPMGLKNASAIFSQFMDTVLGSLKHEYVLPYTDGAAVVSRCTFDDHLHDVARVLHRFADWGLQLNVDKCATPKDGWTTKTCCCPTLMSWSGLHHCGNLPPMRTVSWSQDNSKPTNPTN